MQQLQYATVTAVRPMIIGTTAYRPGERVLAAKGAPDAVAHLRAHLRWSACRVDLGPIAAPTAPAEGVDLRATIADQAAEIERLRAQLDALQTASHDQALVPQALITVPAEHTLGRAITEATDELLISAPGIGAKNVRTIKAWAADLVAQHPITEEPAPAATDEPAAG